MARIYKIKVVAITLEEQEKTLKLIKEMKDKLTCDVNFSCKRELTVPERIQFIKALDEHLDKKSNIQFDPIKYISWCEDNNKNLWDMNNVDEFIDTYKDGELNG